MTELLTKERVLEALRAIKAPGSANDIVAQRLVSEIVIHKGKVYFAISADPARAHAFEAVREAAERAVKTLPGAESVAVTLTADRAPGGAALEGRAQGAAFTRPGAARDARHRPGGVPGVANIVAVASGKGGVGKSTVAVNLALALKERGLKVGILDADIYGPSMPRLLGLKGQPQQIAGNQLAPMQAYGLKAMSMGFLVDEETPMIWRGPMVMSALSQMLKDVAWGELDVLVVDMPPGTGDAQLTMAQQVPLAGAVIVSTPQDLALIDARKGLNMFRRVNVPVLGLVENMSTFVCPHCGKPSNIFGHGGARAEAERLGVPFLGEVPLTIALREMSDEGRPVVAADPGSEAAKAFREIAERTFAELERNKRGARQAPRIVMES
ncbi:MAG TPA: iron-sulfur cluster carrier protein ApbC [Methyloceanibacter sp.]|nr:iron-sulfur cluster carrier protein ApbC [Methyloceanibacter sp.]